MQRGAQILQASRLGRHTLVHMRVVLRSGAKINLGLGIGPVRPDGFHELVTLYQTLELGAISDLLSMELVEASTGSAERVGLTSNDLRVPLDGRNTVAKMLAWALAVPDRAGLAVRVHLEKRLPVQGGLGAGSANAAVALVGLERLIARAGAAAPLPAADQLRLAEEVGSDVPLFLLGGAVLGLGRGEQVVPLPDAVFSGAGRAAPLEVLLAVPEVGVSTPAAFRAWDEAHSRLTPEASTDRLARLRRLLTAAWCEPHSSGAFAASGKCLAGTLLSTLVQTGILQNDFEQVVFRQHPFLEQIKRALVGESSATPAVYAALSGSGSALFGLYAGLDARAAAEVRLSDSGSGLGVRTLRAQTQTRREYWESLVAEED